jgi:hypothetical protein
MRANSDQLIPRHAPSRKDRSIGLFGHVRARSNIIAARFGQIG